MTREYRKIKDARMLMGHVGRWNEPAFQIPLWRTCHRDGNSHPHGKTPAALSSDTVSKMGVASGL